MLDLERIRKRYDDHDPDPTDIPALIEEIGRAAEEAESKIEQAQAEIHRMLVLMRKIADNVDFRHHDPDGQAPVTTDDPNK